MHVLSAVVLNLFFVGNRMQAARGQRDGEWDDCQWVISVYWG